MVAAAWTKFHIASWAPKDVAAPRLSETMREAILTAITVPAFAEAPNGGPDAAPAAERVAVHAVALQALLTEALGVLSPAASPGRNVDST